MKITIPKLQAMRDRGERIAMITCYDATFARLFDAAGVEILLVGDSLGMVIQGHATTLPVAIADVAYHTKAVARTRPHAHVMADMPFMSYQASTAQALENAGRLMKMAGAESVKVEGGAELVATVAAMVAAGIPVMAHIGLKPQRVHQMGGYKIQGKDVPGADRLLEEALAFQSAGAFGLLLEGVAMEVAEAITGAVTIPTVGISSGPGCDGQVLVMQDLLGLTTDFSPRFVKQYADLGALTVEAVRTYRADVKDGTFPTEAHAFHRGLVPVEKIEGC